MPSKNHNLHGNAPDHSEVVLLLIDVINDLEFPGGKELLKFALPMAEKISALKTRAKEAGIPAIYVNDNFGKWRSDFKKLVAHCTEENVCGRPLVERLKPDQDDYFVLKPKHSGFFSTTLDVLLDYLGAKMLILTGIAGNNCVLFTASDAYMRDFFLVVPSDCVISQSVEENNGALNQIKTVLKADIQPSEQISFEALRHLLRFNRLGAESGKGEEALPAA